MQTPGRRLPGTGNSQCKRLRGLVLGCLKRKKQIVTDGAGEVIGKGQVRYESQEILSAMQGTM